MLFKNAALLAGLIEAFCIFSEKRGMGGVLKARTAVCIVKGQGAIVAGQGCAQFSKFKRRCPLLRLPAFLFAVLFPEKEAQGSK
ncbi:MAG TPA: hypothetical protein VNW30_11255 [Opitutaceae bacterium]|nr:hypothetical protein [Opitutaceae bacterium]